LQPSDVIVTSGLGELFPEGIVIGTVIERRVGDFGLTHMATIQPAATFTHLREVFVVEVPSLD
jgi:rod shape-determining protein MreC